MIPLKMRRRTHVVLVFGAFSCVLWLDSPDAVAPLILAVPFFAPSLLSGGFHAVDCATILAIVGSGLAVATFLKPNRPPLFFWNRAALIASAAVFVGTSKPMFAPAMSAIPFAILALWPSKK